MTPMKDQRPHPMEAIFAARRAYDNARITLYRTLAAWATGEVGNAQIEPSLTAIEHAQAALLEAVRDHRDSPANGADAVGPPPVRQLGALRNFRPKSGIA